MGGIITAPIENPVKVRYLLLRKIHKNTYHRCSIPFRGVQGSPGGLVKSLSELTIFPPTRWELWMPELGRADGVWGHAERLRLEPRRQAKAERQACERCLPNTGPHGCHEERAGQTGEEDWALITSLHARVSELPVHRASPSLSRRDARSRPPAPHQHALLCWEEDVSFQLLTVFEKGIRESSHVSSFSR